MPTRSKSRVADAPFREVPFWSWNDVLDKKEALRQVDLMADGGWGGFFMHARAGLVTEYMGREWMAIVKACVARARSRGMCAYLYDENRWPSGFAGGLVPRKSARFRSKFLLLSENVAESGPLYKHLASFAVTSRAGRLSAIPLERGSRAPRGARVLHLHQYTVGLGEKWLLDSAYVDLLEPATTREFIRVTHERYRRAVGRDFGGAVPAIFTDEPSLGFSDHCPGVSVPWTETLPRVFRRSRGYDPFPHLLSLFLPVGDFRKVRYDFYRTVNEMFVANFAGQLFRWCEKHNIALTGHMNAEDTLASQMKYSVGVMPFYEYFHTPGMDHLGLNVSDPATAKQVSSVADQLGRPRVLSELYGCSGQDLSLKGRKWLADWHLAIGVNLLNPHLWLYSMRGARKRDFPPNIAYQQPHWPKSRALSDRNARLSRLLTRGRRVVDVLVVHPIETGWCLTTPLDPGAIAKFDTSFQALTASLLAAHLDFHFGDESLMAKYASVSDGRLRVGKCGYKVAIVSETLTLRESTALLLERFSAEGGTVILVNCRPSLLEGSRDGAALLRRALSPARVVPLNGVAAAVRKAHQPAVTITGPNASSVLYHLRDVSRRRLLFLANTDYDSPASVQVAVRADARYAAVLPESSASFMAVPVRRASGRLAFSVSLAPAGSAIFELGPKPYPAPARAPLGRARRIALGGEWSVTRADENALTLDYVRLPHPARTWTAPEYVLFAAETLRETGGPARVRYEFDVETLPRGPVHLGFERPERWTILVNGSRVPSTPKGFFVDTAFKRINITRRVRAGRNVVELRGRVTPDFELESIYVVGRFGVYRRNGAFHIAAPPAEVSPADLSAQGYCFFAGTVDIEKTVTLDRAPKSAAFSLAALDAGAAELFVNGRSQGDLLYPPYQLKVTGLKPGANRVTLRLFSTLRNLLGPHHFEGPEIKWVSPGSFVNRKLWNDSYRFLPFGTKGATLLVR